MTRHRNRPGNLISAALSNDYALLAIAVLMAVIFHFLLR